MNIEKSNTNCTGCQACVEICPKQCIRMEANKEGFLYPHVDNNGCVDCGLCTKRCPANYPLKRSDGVREAFQAVSKLPQKENSSSGGCFYTMAKSVILENGIVFGAGFDENFHVQHMWVDSVDELYKLQGSKYVQSDIKNSYKQAKSFLQQGKKVLFSGTPCQVAGLYAALGNNWQNLITVDLICHGTPGTHLWDNYVLMRNHEKKIQNIRFRVKSKNDKSSYKLLFQYIDGTYKIIRAEEDAYFSSFLKNESLRESCYSCQYATLSRCGDITLGDCATAVKYTKEDFKPFEAVSSILINSEKGKELWNNISDQLEWKALDVQNESLENHQLSRATTRPKSRDTALKRGNLYNILENNNAILEYPVRGVQKIKYMITDSLTIKMRYRLKSLQKRKKSNY